VTDGTELGTYMVKDINPTPGRGSYPSQFTSLGNGTAVFSADDGTHGAELWMTDGTAAGTYMVMDIYPAGLSDVARARANSKRWNCAVYRP
jgi:ELWxxDGT repeat protein